MTQISKLTYDECLAAMAIKKIHQQGLSEIVKEVLNERTKMIDEFAPLLKEFVENTSDQLVASEELCCLWVFFCMGIYSTSLRALHSNTEFSVRDLTRLGPVVSRKLLYDRCYQLLFNNSNDEVFVGLEPTVWYDKVTTSFNSLKDFFQSQNTDNLIPILEEICTALTDPDCDPVQQR